MTFHPLPAKAPPLTLPTPHSRAALLLFLILNKHTVGRFRSPRSWALGECFPGTRWGRPGRELQAPRTGGAGWVGDLLGLPAGAVALPHPGSAHAAPSAPAIVAPPSAAALDLRSLHAGHRQPLGGRASYLCSPRALLAPQLRPRSGRAQAPRPGTWRREGRPDRLRGKRVLGPERAQPAVRPPRRGQWRGRRARAQRPSPGGPAHCTASERPAARRTGQHRAGPRPGPGSPNPSGWRGGPAAPTALLPASPPLPFYPLPPLLLSPPLPSPPHPPLPSTLPSPPLLSSQPPLPLPLASPSPLPLLPSSPLPSLQPVRLPEERAGGEFCLENPRRAKNSTPHQGEGFCRWPFLFPLHCQ